MERSSVRVRVASVLRDAGPATLTHLARELGLSRTSVENATSALMKAGLVGEADGPVSSGAGRPARWLKFNSAAGVVIGIDVGTSGTRVVAADLAGRVVASSKHPASATADGAPEKLGSVVEAVRETLRTAGVPLRRLRAVGMSLPGLIDDGTVVASVVIPEWTGIDLGARLRNSLGCPVSIDNGVRLAVIAEHHLGAAQLVNDVAYLSVGNRIAMGLILGGLPRHGAHNAAGDIGRLAFRGLDTRTGRIDWSSADSAEAVFRAADEGDEEAQLEIDRFIGELAHGIATVAMTVDPAMIVIGGGLSLAGPKLIGPLEARVQELIGLPFRLPLVAARLGTEAAAYGALVYAFMRHRDAIYGLGLSVPEIVPTGC